MQHIAIMKKSLEFLEKIIEGTKTIESRWSINKIGPFGKIKSGETIYFKNSSENINAKAKVSKVIEFGNLSQSKVKQIIKTYGVKIGISKNDTESFFQQNKDKNYCILIFLKNVKQVKPFSINKSGFGIQSAWLTLQNVNIIKQTANKSKYKIK